MNQKSSDALLEAEPLLRVGYEMLAIHLPRESLRTLLRGLIYSAYRQGHYDSIVGSLIEQGDCWPTKKGGTNI